MKQLRRCSRLLLLVMVGLVISSCGAAAPVPDVRCLVESSGYCASLQASGAGQVEISRDVSFASRDLAAGSAVELFEVQAASGLASGVMTEWRPDFQTTAVIVIDRARTDAVVTTWSDLLSISDVVGLSPYETGRWLLTGAIRWGLEEDPRPGGTELALLADLRRQGRLSDSTDGVAVWIDFDHHAVDLIASGRDLEVVVPSEGTLTFVKGLASAGELPAPGDLGDRLAKLGYAPAQGQPPASSVLIGIDELDYRAGWFAQYRRQVLSHHLFHSADLREHTITPVVAMVALIAWVGSFARRGSQRSVRRASVAIGGLAAFWLGARMVKYQVAPPWEDWLWYLFYLPLLGLPLCLLWLAWAVDRPVDVGRPPGWWWALVGVNAALLVFVLTNDYHELVFDFGAGPGGSSYSYAPGYYPVAVAAGVPLIWAVAWLAVKSRRVPGRRMPWLPELILAGLAAYLVGYNLGVPIVRQTDMTLVIIFAGLALIESAVRTGKLPLNSRYGKFFRASSLKMRIIDASSGGAIVAAGSESGDQQTATQVERSAQIRGGRVVWTEDLSAMAALERHTSVAVGQMETLHAMLTKSQEKQRTAVSSQVRADLLGAMDAEVGVQLADLDQIVAGLPLGPVDDRTLARVTLRICFIKRRAALFFQLQSGESLSADTMDQLFSELAQLAQPADLKVTVRCPISSPIPVQYPELLYECVFVLIDHAVQVGARAVVGQVSLTGPRQQLSMLLPAEFVGFGFPAGLVGRLAGLGAEVVLRQLDESFTLAINVPCPEVVGQVADV